MKQDLFSSRITKNPQPYKEITEFPDLGKDLYLTEGRLAFGDRWLVVCMYYCVRIMSLMQIIYVNSFASHYGFCKPALEKSDNTFSLDKEFRLKTVSSGRT